MKEQFTLGDLITFLRKIEREKLLEGRRALGFASPHSYRGYYECLAFEPSSLVDISEMLKSAESALGKVFDGYKGGKYRMDERTPVYLARYGESGVVLTPDLLMAMLSLQSDED